ncbi:acyltransferase [Maridesulfovibrio salexigens]|uniref:Acetyltransferase (Isoleucine patch superfamily)-like protein n=1 Tax=Maridesulfovibrio salexigens (strain ATCC 14822 / DSM 2638 / NCIMB 8403 / VKM B-1763) TaxID=526222 RepID=C6BS95_MARSD|nr:acyltransferase [Maridesulfovibrio salexigens]ACS79571.1 Acetyltransferase (isoleucine patch superfamily)-like protein [Maridesulfovibrio salexigens DSM 2638]
MKNTDNINILGDRNSLEYESSSISNASIDIIGNDNVIKIHPSAQLGSVKIVLRGDRHRLFVGRNVKISAGLLRLIHGAGLIAIGAGTTIVEAEIISFEVGTKIIIGEDCLISYGVHAWTGDAHSIVDATTGKRINHGRDITIGNHVWIGYEAVLLKGATIGHDSILGARTVLSKKIPPQCLAAGNPAKIIKKNVTWDPEVFYEKDSNPLVAGENVKSNS